MVATDDSDRVIKKQAEELLPRLWSPLCVTGKLRCNLFLEAIAAGKMADGKCVMYVQFSCHVDDPGKEGDVVSTLSKGKG